MGFIVINGVKVTPRWLSILERPIPQDKLSIHANAGWVVNSKKKKQSISERMFLIFSYQSINLSYKRIEGYLQN